MAVVIHTKKWEDKGLGDTIERITKATGIKRMTEAISKATGKDCGCDKRKEKLNEPNILVNKLFYNKKK